MSIPQDTKGAVEDTGHTSSSKVAPPKPGQTASPTLTDTPSHTSNSRSDPSSLPPPQSKTPGSATSRGDAPETGSSSASDQRQVNKGNSIGNTSDAKARLSGTTSSGPVSMSGTETSHPGANGTPAAGAPVGDPSSGQASKTEKQGSATPLDEPKKSKEDKKEVKKEDKKDEGTTLPEPKKSKEDEEDEGTGQKYVKSSGVVAEGGDFDASNPGAGMEATRLMRKAGKSLPSDDQSKPKDAHDPKAKKEATDEEPKAGLGEKIKGVLHKDPATHSDDSPETHDSNAKKEDTHDENQSGLGAKIKGVLHKK